MRMKQSFAAAVLTVLMVTGVAVPVQAIESDTNYSNSNATIAQLVELIAKLTKQLETLRAGGSCFVSDATLSLGDGETGDGLTDDVERLQGFLREKGFFTFSKNTGFFGKITRTALTSYQASAGVAQTGDFDLATREKAHAMTCTKISNARTEVKHELKPELKLDMIKKEEKKKETPVATPSTLTSISLSGSGSLVTWSTVGKSAQGFKVVWSKESGPTYPPREGDKVGYHPDLSGGSMSIDAFKGAGAYYVRVCEYVGNTCGVYSNEITVNLQ